MTKQHFNEMHLSFSYHRNFIVMIILYHKYNMLVIFMLLLNNNIIITNILGFQLELVGTVYALIKASAWRPIPNFSLLA